MTDRCPQCGHVTGYLMESHPDKPGLAALLRGDGDDRLMIRVAWMFVLLVVFASACALFWALGQVP